MNIIFVRHSKPDYSFINKHDSNSLVNIAPLSKEGVLLAIENQFSEKELKNFTIISSPYTRALQTAYIMTNSNQIIVEPLLHEWLPSKTFSISVKDIPDRDKRYKQMLQGVNYFYEKYLAK